MGLMIDVGGGAAQLGAGLGAGFASGVEQGLDQQREDALIAQHQQEQQALADEMVSAVSQDFAARADETRSGIDKFTDMGSPTQVPGGLPVFLKPGINPDLKGHDEWVAQQMGVLQSMKSPEAAQLYKDGLTRQLDQVIRARAEKRLGLSINHGRASGALPEGVAQGLMQKLKDTGDPAQVYNDLVEYRSQKSEADARTLRGTRRMESMEMESQRLATSTSGFDQDRAREIMGHIDQARHEIEQWGDEDFDYEAFEEAYDEIKDRYSPAQQAKVDAASEKQKLETAKILSSVIRDLEAKDGDASQYRLQLQGILGQSGGVVGTDEAGNTFGAETTFPEQGVGAGVVAPGGTINGGVEPAAEFESSPITPILGEIEKGISSGSTTPQQASEDLVGALKAAGWDGESSLKEWMLTLPAEQQGNIKSTRAKILEAQTQAKPVKQAAPPAAAGRTEVSSLDDRQLFEQLLQDTAKRWKEEGVSAKDIAKGLKQMREAN